MDPYKVLGVPRDADEETIKKAYKDLVKKYHPDRYINSPMADMASEKMKEINMAYDMLTGKNQSTQNQGGGGYYGGYSTAGIEGFEAVRLFIKLGNIAGAESILSSLPKTAQWYYLYGLIYMRKGWYDKAVEYITRATEMEPDNIEYRSTLENMSKRNTQYQRTYTTEYGSTCLNDCCRFLPCIICLPCPCRCCVC